MVMIPLKRLVSKMKNNRFTQFIFFIGKKNFLLHKYTLPHAHST